MKPGAVIVGLMASLCSAQTGSFEIRLPGSVPSESLAVRYVLTGDFGQFAGWVDPEPEVMSYKIATTHEGYPASHIKAIVYSPGCALQTLDLPLRATAPNRYDFQCEPLRTVTLHGTITRLDRFYRHRVKIRASYVAWWAQSFFESPAGLVTEIPLGEFSSIGSANEFTLQVPDLARDPIAGSPGKDGAFHLWTRDEETGQLIALLVPSAKNSGSLKTGMKGLKIRLEYPAEIQFSTCASNPPLAHDGYGFALRPDANDACTY